ncbi:unnamed protein product [Rotaria sordida]|nr:unnamed protein product [Rotaria sordida]CAF4197387.1 unnamed protein product [Rotaria sordida]
MENPISYYTSMTEKIVHFQISILIQIIQYDDQNEIQVPISHRNITIKQLLGMIEIKDNYKYLASCETKMILSENIQLSAIHETKFFLAKEHQTCLASIEQSEDTLIAINDESMQNQRYLINATVGDIYKHNKNIDQDQSLLYDRDFIPSREISLSSFLSTRTSIIEFKLTYQKFQANITVTSEEQKSSIEFQCEPKMTIRRAQEIVCQLWKLNQNFYRLTFSDDSIIDEDESLNDTGESLDDLQLKLSSTADVKCAITYKDGTILISATNETSLSSIKKEALEKLLIPLDDIDMFNLKLLDDPECPTNVDLDSTIDDLSKDFSVESDTLPFLLEKKEDES